VGAADLSDRTGVSDWLQAAGFSGICGYGEDGSPLTVEHRRLITVASR
jgi:hypothetical protein